MNIYQTTVTRFLCLSLVLAVLMGCGGKPAEFKQTAGEMKEGPGVLTGEEGAFTVYDSKKGGPFWDRSKEKSAESAEAQPDKASAEAGIAASDQASGPGQAGETGGGASGTPGISPEAAREFREFQEWKKEQKEFQEFQKWKKTSEGAAEYREFLEWKEWKTYQEWKKRQGQ